MRRDYARVKPAGPAPSARRRAGRRAALALLLSWGAGLGVAATPGVRAPNRAAAGRGIFILSAFARAGPQGGDFSKFSHTTTSHASLVCASCHARESNASAPVLPGHKACTDCHVQQFVTQGSPMCAICHTGLELGNPPVKAFPALRSFAVRFDHAQHQTGAARPAAACASCHAPARRGVALSIPAGPGAHANCYQCHTPGARGPTGRDISSCGACHALGRYARTPTGAKAYGVSFSHATHGSRQGLGCADCHGVRAGLPQSRQVSSPRPQQHFISGRGQNCATCHDNRRAFGGEDFSDCKRCHRGPSFRF